jgi:hypothetical protein
LTIFIKHSPLSIFFKRFEFFWLAIVTVQRVSAATQWDGRLDCGIQPVIQDSLHNGLSDPSQTGKNTNEPLQDLKN